MTAPTLAAAYAHGYGKDVHSGPMPSRPRPSGTGVPFTALDPRLASTLRTALAPRRFEPWNPFNDHRAYPSPRAAYLVDAILRLDSGRWLVDPVRERLIPTAGEPGPVTVELVPRADRLPSGYGALATALAVLETGHVVAALADAAAESGLVAAPLASGFGLKLTRVGDAPPPARPPRPARSSGLGPRGVTADPRPLPGRALDRLLGAPTGAGLRHALAVRNVPGRVDGWYTVDVGRLLPVRAGAAMDEVAAAYTYPRQQIDVAGMNVAWVMTADIAATVREHGPDAYHRSLLAAGATAQRVADAAAGAGLFCRPARAVREDRIEAACAAPAGHDFVYLLLLGRSRVRDFGYDLTTLEVSR